MLLGCSQQETVQGRCVTSHVQSQERTLQGTTLTLSLSGEAQQVRGQDLRSVRARECHLLAGGSWLGLVSGVVLALMAALTIAAVQRCRGAVKPPHSEDCIEAEQL